MGYWEEICSARKVSRFEKFARVEDSGIMSVLIRPSGYFLVRIEGNFFHDERKGRQKFVASAAPMHSAWEVQVDDTPYGGDVGRVGMSGLRADGEHYSASVPYVPRPNFLSPSNLVYYNNLPIWGSRIERFPSDFIPHRAEIGNERFARIICRPIDRREDPGAQAEIIFDLRHRLAVYYRIEQPDGLAIEISASKASIITEPTNPQIEETYIAK